MSLSFCFKSSVTKLIEWCSWSNLVNERVCGRLEVKLGFARKLWSAGCGCGCGKLSSTLLKAALYFDCSSWYGLMYFTFKVLILLFWHLILMFVLVTLTTSAGPNHLGANLTFLPWNFHLKKTKSTLLLTFCFTLYLILLR